VVFLNSIHNYQDYLTIAHGRLLPHPF
jgi:hypothetical protein